MVVSLKKVVSYIAALALLFCLSLGARKTRAYAVYLGGTPRSLPIYSVDREEKLISISFDCAWGTQHTEGILSALKASSVSATWFMVEFWTEKYPDVVKKIDEEGHEIGTHSATHSHMSGQSEGEIIKELSTSSRAIENITGKRVELFRPPYGDYDDLLIDTALSQGYFPIQWDVDSLDWKNLSAADIANRVVTRVQSGSIILMHNNGLHTAEAVPIILKTLILKGYSFVPIGKLIYRENYIIGADGRQKSAD